MLPSSQSSPVSILLLPHRSGLDTILSALPPCLPGGRVIFPSDWLVPPSPGDCEMEAQPPTRRPRPAVTTKISPCLDMYVDAAGASAGARGAGGKLGCYELPELSPRTPCPACKPNRRRHTACRPCRSSGR